MTVKKDKKDYDKQGRPTKYNPEVHNDIIYKLAKKGFTDEELAESLNICRATLTIWKREYPDLLAMISEGKADADMEVEKTLYQRALGYEFKEHKVTTESVTIKKDGVEIPGEKTKEETTTKQMAPDYNSMRLWLINRKKADWKDRHDHTIVDNTDYEKEVAKMNKIKAEMEFERKDK